jgi:hypothetical protein
MLQLEDMVAVQKGEGVQHIGHLFWYMVGDDLYHVDKVTEAIVDTGLHMSLAPNPIRASGAFSRAAKSVETRRSGAKDSGEHYNYLVRNVTPNRGEIERRIVKETVDSKGRRLSYDPSAAVLVLDQKTETVSVYGNDDTALELGYEAQKRYEIFRTHYGPDIVRIIILNALRMYSAVPVKPSGGIYFVPEAHDEGLERLKNFCSFFPKMEGYKIVVVENNESIEMVTEKVADHLENIYSQCRGILSQPEVAKSHLSKLLTEARGIVNGYRDYEKIVAENKENIEARVEMVREAIGLLFDRVSMLEEC